VITAAVTAVFLIFIEATKEESGGSTQRTEILLWEQLSAAI
jgi:hypothetical protein